MKERVKTSPTVVLGLNVYLEVTTEYSQNEYRKVSADQYLMAPASGAANIGCTIKLLDENSYLNCHLFAITGPKHSNQYSLGAKLAEGLKYDLEKKSIIFHPYPLRDKLPISNNIIERNAKRQITYEKGIVCRPRYKIKRPEAEILASLVSDDLMLSQIILKESRDTKKVITLSMDLIKNENRKVVKIRKKILESADYLIQNEEETKMLLKRENPKDWLGELQSMPEKDVIVTLGEDGVIALTNKGEYFYQPAFPVKAVDSTGVGDAFVGGFIYASCIGMDFKEALRWGAAAGAVQVKKRGGHPKLTRTEIENMLNLGG